MNNGLPAVNNSHECDKYLSAFGRKVFGVLLKQYTTGDFTRSKYHCSKNTANRHEVSWQRRDERSSSLSGTNNNLTNVNYDIERNIFENQENASNSPNNSSSLLSEKEKYPAKPKTVKFAKGTEDLGLSVLNTNINITPDSSQITNSQPNVNLNMHKEIAHNFTFHSTENDEVLKSTKEVAWEDMLDCEILDIETCNNVQKPKKLDKINITTNLDNIFELISHNKKPKITKSNCIAEGKKVIINLKVKEKSVVGNDKVTEHTSPEGKCKRNNKNKSDNTHTVTAVPKKVAKVTEKKSKPNFLKRKNTKAINNWLDVVDPTHLVDGIDIQSGVLIPSTPNILAENPNDILQISLENVEFQDRYKKNLFKPSK